MLLAAAAAAAAAATALAGSEVLALAREPGAPMDSIPLEEVGVVPDP